MKRIAAFDMLDFSGLTVVAASLFPHPATPTNAGERYWGLGQAEKRVLSI